MMPERLDENTRVLQAEQDGEARMLYAPVGFEDLAGNPIPTWQVPLDEYVAIHERAGIPGDWRSTHLLIVARAIAFDQPVPENVAAPHDPQQLRLLVLRERCNCNRDEAACEELKTLLKVGTGK